jgi:SAM-dependent methyltransferase
MSLRPWDEHVVPRLVDVSLRGREIGELRGRVCAGLSGRVVEIGFGSGLNIRWYPPAVTSVSAVEPSDVAWRLSEKRRRRSGVRVERAGLDGQHLALPDGGHDAALVTFSLCTIPDPGLALREVRRVVAPEARLHFIEHGLAPEPGVQRWQRRWEPWQRRIAGGCHLTRDMPTLISANGWELESLDTFYLPGPRIARPWTYLFLGVARSV